MTETNSFEGPGKLDRIRAESDAVYATLSEKLAEREQAATAIPGWTAAQVFGHLGRWLDESHADLLRHRNGTPRPHREEDEDSLNDRWAAEDATLSTHEAQSRCMQARDRLFAALAEVPEAQWDATVEGIARDDTVIHPRAHLATLP